MTTFESRTDVLKDLVFRLEATLERLGDHPAELEEIRREIAERWAFSTPAVNDAAAEGADEVSRKILARFLVTLARATDGATALMTVAEGGVVAAVDVAALERLVQDKKLALGAIRHLIRGLYLALGCELARAGRPDELTRDWSLSVRRAAATRRAPTPALGTAVAA